MHLITGDGTRIIRNGSKNRMCVEIQKRINMDMNLKIKLK